MNTEHEWFEGGDGHGYVYQYIGPIHYLCECGAYFLNRDGWMFHKGAESALADAAERIDALKDDEVPWNDAWPQALNKARRAILYTRP